MPARLTRRFWMTVRTPADARPGLYKGTMTIRTDKRGTSTIPVEFRVRAGKLDPVDIPAGPFGYTIGIPWFGDDPACRTIQSANDQKEPAKDARLWLHSLQRRAVDRLPRVHQRQASPGFPAGRCPDEPRQGVWGSWR